jgi:hypothetical protein
VRHFQEFCHRHQDISDGSIISAGPIDGIPGPLTRAALDHYYYFFLRKPFDPAGTA